MKNHYLFVFSAVVLLAVGCNSNAQVIPLPTPSDRNANLKPSSDVPVPAAVPVAVVPSVNNEPNSSIGIQTQSSLNGSVGQEFVAVFVASGGSEPYAWRITKGSLPPGLSLEPILVIPDCAPPAPPEKPNCPAPYNDPTSIKITGTSTESGSFPITLSTTDIANYSASVSALLTIK